MNNGRVDILVQVLAIQALEVEGNVHVELRLPSTKPALQGAAPRALCHRVRDVALQLMCIFTINPSIGSVFAELATNTRGLECYLIELPCELVGCTFEVAASRLQHAVLLGCAALHRPPCI